MNNCKYVLTMNLFCNYNYLIKHTKRLALMIGKSHLYYVDQLIHVQRGRALALILLRYRGVRKVIFEHNHTFHLRDCARTQDPSSSRRALSAVKVQE